MIETGSGHLNEGCIQKSAVRSGHLNAWRIQKSAIPSSNASTLSTPCSALCPEPVHIMRRSFETNKFLILWFFSGGP